MFFHSIDFRRKQPWAGSYLSHSLILVFVVFSLVCRPVFSGLNEGELDPSFGTDGKVSLSYGGSNVCGGNDGLLLGDGKLIMVGACAYTGDSDIVVLRLNSDGTLDASFGNGGGVRTSAGSDFDSANGVAVQADGKLVVVGYTENQSFELVPVVLRYEADGTLDSSFGMDGIFVLPLDTLLNSEGRAYSVLIQLDGKILVGGFSNGDPKDVAFLARLHSNGTLDNSFNGDGITTVPADAYITDLELGTSGDIYASLGISFDYTELMLVRFDADGSLDGSFGQGGMAGIFAGDRANVNGLVVDPAGRILVVGSARPVDGDDVALARFLPDGNEDTSFGNNGLVLTPIGNTWDRGYDVALQADGRYVVSADVVDDLLDNSEAAVLRYLANGSLDPTFGTGGIVVTNVSTDTDIPQKVILQPDGKILLVGEAGQNRFMAIRYLAEAFPPPPDPTLGQHHFLPLVLSSDMGS